MSLADPDSLWEAQVLFIGASMQRTSELMTPARDRFADGGLAGVGASLLALASLRSASACSAVVTTWIASKTEKQHGCGLRRLPTKYI